MLSVRLSRMEATWVGTLPTSETHAELNPHERRSSPCLNNPLASRRYGEYLPSFIAEFAGDTDQQSDAKHDEVKSSNHGRHSPATLDSSVDVHVVRSK